MILDRDGNTTIITQEKIAVTALIKQIEAAYETLANDHLIVNLTSFEAITLEQVLEFLRLSNTHRSAKKSFVLVSEKVNLEDMPDEIIVVPTIQEAYDIIDMEDMERDLGF